MGMLFNSWMIHCTIATLFKGIGPQKILNSLRTNGDLYENRTFASSLREKLDYSVYVQGKGLKIYTF